MAVLEGWSSTDWARSLCATRILGCVWHHRALLGEGSVGQHPWSMALSAGLAAVDELPQCSISATPLWRPLRPRWCRRRPWAGRALGRGSPRCGTHASYWLLGQFQQCLKRVGSISSARHPVFPSAGRAFGARWGTPAETGRTDPPQWQVYFLLGACRATAMCGEQLTPFI